jgi:aminoglycoside 3-N-acetyltransferase
MAAGPLIFHISNHMNDPILFRPAQGNAITTNSLLHDLRAIGAADCEVLFIHSGLNLGAPNPELGRRGLLSEIWGVFQKLGVPTLCMPTFTFSFPNGQDYDVAKSPTRMGALNDFVRQLPEAIRSMDPIMSVALTGRESELVKRIGKYSCGPDCTYDLLHRRGGGVTFLFLGARSYECFTFTHYVEAQLKVPFRYHRPFTGRITQGERTWEDTYFHFARYNGVVPTTGDKLERYLEATGRIRKRRLGNSWLTAVNEPDGYAAMSECLEQDPFYLAARRYSPEEMRDTRFLEKDIIAL